MVVVIFVSAIMLPLPAMLSNLKFGAVTYTFISSFGRRLMPFFTLTFSTPPSTSVRMYFIKFSSASILISNFSPCVMYKSKEPAVLTPSKLASFLVEVVTFPFPLTLLQPQEEILINRVTAITAVKMRFIIFCFTV